MILPDVPTARFYWQHAGVLRLPGFAADETLYAEFEAAVPPVRDGQRVFVRNALANSDAMRALVERVEFASWLNAVLAQRMQPIGGDATRYVGATYWHRDVTGGALPLAKLVVYLDPVHPATASFRYVPGSHTPQFAAMVPSAAAVACDVAMRSLTFQARDALLFCPRLLHSVAETAQRRQLAVIYSALPATLDEHSELARLLAANSAIL